jgi:hypothetical protein
VKRARRGCLEPADSSGKCRGATAGCAAPEGTASGCETRANGVRDGGSEPRLWERASPKKGEAEAVVASAVRASGKGVGIASGFGPGHRIRRGEIGGIAAEAGNLEAKAVEVMEAECRKETA